MAVVTGELIRAMNYVDDITATVRRMCLYIPSMNAEERKRLAVVPVQDCNHQKGDDEQTQER